MIYSIVRNMLGHKLVKCDNEGTITLISDIYHLRDFLNLNRFAELPDIVDYIHQLDCFRTRVRNYEGNLVLVWYKCLARICQNTGNLWVVGSNEEICEGLRIDFCSNCQDSQSNCSCDVVIEEEEEEEEPNEGNLAIIQEYGFKPPIQFLGGETIYPFRIGMEWELNTDKPRLVLREAQKAYPNLFYGVNDSSISGVEVISFPASVEFWRKFSHVPQNIISAEAGIHLHVCRAGFNDFQIRQILSLFHYNRSLINKVAGRNLEEITWSKIWTRSSWPRADYDLQNYVGGDKYSAINFKHRETLEFRIFDSTVKPHIIQKNFEFIIALWTWSQLPKQHSYLRDFLGHVAKSDLPNLKACLSFELSPYLSQESLNLV